jgi:hypothetical protein
MVHFQTTHENQETGVSYHLPRTSWKLGNLGPTPTTWLWLQEEYRSCELWQQEILDLKE